MLADPEVLPLITATAEAFSQAVGQGIGKRPMPAAMRSMLEQNVFIFSGFKTHAELSAVSALLLDESGKKKPFERFARDVQAIDENYNLNYLRAEYNFATQSARSAAMWAQYQADGDQFYLQYRTAADERVRESHALLHGTTLPVNDPFWKKFFPPNGWNCRCTVVQVRKSKYPLSDSKHAIELGEKATTALNKHGQNKLAIFRFNPGQEQKIFPPRHPYLPKGCGNCNKNQLDYNPSSEICMICTSLVECMKKATIEDHREAYMKLVKSGEYRDLAFDETTGAYKATSIHHVSHNNLEFFNNTMSSSSLEKSCIDILFKHGDRVILRDEKQSSKGGINVSVLDLYRNGEILDIRSITENMDNTIANGLCEKNKQLRRAIKAKTGASDKLCLYFHEPSYWSEEKMKKSIDSYKNIMTSRGSEMFIREVLVVLGNGDVKEYNI